MAKLFSNATETDFPEKVPVFWRAVPCFWTCIITPCSYLIFVLVHCGAVRTISKDLDIPYPSNRDYEYLEDYPHWQMKEWVCSHAPKSLLNDRCENKIRSYWETCFSTSHYQASIPTFRLCAPKGSSLNTEIVVSLFWEFPVKPPKTLEDQLVKR